MLSELDAFFALYAPKLADEMFQGSGGSTLAGGDGTNVIDPSAPPNDSPEDSGSGNAAVSDGLAADPYEPNPLGCDVLNESRPYELKGSAPKGARRSDSAGQSEPSLLAKARGGVR